MSNIRFNEQQLEAINTYKGAYGVISSAGSGKSSVLLNRVKYLIEERDVDEDDILAITFTRNTSNELRKKLEDMGYFFVNVGTFHAICMNVLNSEGYDLDGRKFIKEWQIEKCLKEVMEKVDVDDVMSFIGYQKNHMIGYNDEFVEKECNYTKEDLREFFKAYEEFKEKNNLYDFDDLLLECLDVLREEKGKYTFEFILVDEHQDSNSVQQALLKEWCQSGNIFTLGDLRQAIFGFRGSKPGLFMNFELDWNNAKIINMDINYRSAKNIVQKSNEFIRPYFSDYQHYSDAIPYSQEDGEITVKSFSSRDWEATHVANKIESLIEDDVPLKQIAVLYRNNNFPEFLEGELKARDIEYDIANDSSFFKKKEIAGILAYLRLAHDPSDDIAFEEIFKFRNFPLKFFSQRWYREIQKTAKEKGLSMFNAFKQTHFDKDWLDRNASIFTVRMNELIEMAKKDADVKELISKVVKSFNIYGFIKDRYSNPDDAQERIESINVLKSFVKNNNLEQFITYVYSATTQKKKKKEDAVQLMSIHKSKGLEWDYTFVIGIEDGKFPSDRGDINEEARLMYVATTRAKKGLYISEIGRGNRFVQEYGYMEDDENE